MRASMRSMRRWMRFSGGTSQPCLGSIVEALRNTDRDTGLDIAAIRADLVLLGSGARPVRRLRKRPAGPGLRGLSARNAGRPVHQPQGAGALAGAGGALARGGAGLCRRQPDVRRHRQGHAVLEGRGRHGADDGGAGPDPRAGRGPRPSTSPSRNSVVDMLHGNLGQPPGGWPQGSRRRCSRARRR